MKSAKYIIFPGVYTALLICTQLILSGVSGIELVTILLLCFCYRYGVRQGLLVANAFSLLRCLVFGFNVNVLTLYLVYYTIFSITFGLLGKVLKRKYNIKIHALIIVVAVTLTFTFTMLDNVITPLIFGFTWKATKAYFIASFYTLVPHLVCTFMTTLLLFAPLIKVMKPLKN